MLKYLVKVLSKCNCYGYNYSYSNYIKIIIDFKYIESGILSILNSCALTFHFKQIIFFSNNNNS